MILDRLDRIGSYEKMMPYWKEAVDFAMSVKDKPVGNYYWGDAEKKDIFVMVQEGDTKPAEEGLLEAHRKYVDIQIMLEGGETLYYEDIQNLTEAVPYKEDAVFYQFGGQPIRIEPGMFFAAFPQDGHMPCRHLDGPGHYRKMVVKIKIA